MSMKNAVVNSNAFCSFFVLEISVVADIKLNKGVGYDF